MAQVAHHACLEMAAPSLKFQALRAELRQERQEAQEVQELAIWGGEPVEMGHKVLSVSSEVSWNFWIFLMGFSELQIFKFEIH